MNDPAVYEAEIPAEYFQMGVFELLDYMRRSEDQITFPGGHISCSRACDYNHNDGWSAAVIPVNQSTDLFIFSFP